MEEINNLSEILRISINNFQDTIVKKVKAKPIVYKGKKKGFDDKPIVHNRKLYYGKEGVLYYQEKINKYRLNGQSIYNRGWSWQVRNMVVEHYHNYFAEIIRDCKFPKDLSDLYLQFILSYPINSKVPDIDNMWLLVKCFNDTLTLSNIIKDDNPKYIFGFGMEYRFSDNEEIKLTIIINQKIKKL